MNWLDSLLDHMAANGLAPETLLADGELHRFCVDGDKRGSLNGWYCAHPDGIPAAAYGSWKTGESYRWRAAGGQSETSDSRAYVAAQREQRRVEERETQAEAAKRARQIWSACLDVEPSHPYLMAKSVKADGIRQHGDLLVVPLRDDRGNIWSLQFIATTGEKRFLRGGRVRALFHTIGRRTPRVWLCEGYATGCSVFDRFGELVVVVFNAGNLLPVGKAIAKAWVPREIAIMADDDWQTAGNPGVTKAKEAAAELECKWYLPEFPEDRPDWATDFNDASRLHLVQEVAA